MGRAGESSWGWILAIAIGAVSPSAAAAQPGATPSADDPADAAALRQELRRMIGSARDRVFPALVNISVVTAEYWEGKEHKGRSTGSGTIISRDGYVLTNQHVTTGGRKFRCTLADKQEIDAELIGEDPLTDLAVIKLAVSQLADPKAPLPVASFGKSDEVQVGDQVMAMGSPFALARSVTLGIVSNPSRVLAGSLESDDLEEMELESGQRTGLFTRWIQHDALINPGNSGGPLVNLQGQIIGINELGGNSIGFAIPSALAQQVALALIANKEVTRSMLGLGFKPIAKTGLKQGVLVNSVTRGGPADAGGIQAGDVILKINGEPITVRFIEEVPPLMHRIADLPIGSAVAITYERGKEHHDTTLTTRKMLKDRGKEAAFRSWGLTAEEITEYMSRVRKLDNTEGVLVSGVRDGGPAAIAEPALAEDDIIRSIDQEPVRDLKGFAAIYGRIMAQSPPPEFLLIGFDRVGKNQLTVIKPRPDKPDDPPREIAKAWIGVDTQVVLARLAKKLSQPDLRGFRITRVYPGTKAAGSDLKVGDVIVALNGSKLALRGMQDAGLLNRLVRKLDVEGVATLTLLRGQQREEVRVPLERTRIGLDEARSDRNRDFEMTVREITFFDRDENRWGEEVKGVIVSGVERAGWAGLGGIRDGDLLQRIDDQSVDSLTRYREIMERIGREQPRRVVMVVLRGVRTQFQFIEPDWKPVVANESKPAASGPADADPSTTKE